MTLRIVLGATMLLAMCISPVVADGVYIPKIDPASEVQDLTEPSQKAVIAHFDGHERMVLQVSFKGSVKEFAWLVPTPARPEIVLGDASVFHVLHYATAPRIRYWFDADVLVHGLQMTFGSRSAGIAEPAGVDVLERKIVGDYDVSVLKARRETDLLDWLRENGYSISPKLGPALADYIRRGWVFTAARIDTTSAAAGDEPVREGALRALQLDFPTKQPVYPLKISSLNPGRTHVLLYVISDRFVTGPPLSTVCAIDNHTRLDRSAKYRPRLTSELVQSGMLDEAWLTRPKAHYCITKLRAELETHQMAHDIVLQPARSQKVILPPSVSPLFFENLGALALVPVAFVTSFPVAVAGACVFLLIGVVRHRKRDRFPWLLASLLMLVVVVPVSMVGFHVAEVNGYWPAGVAVVVLAAWYVAVKVRRWWLRK